MIDYPSQRTDAVLAEDVDALAEHLGTLGAEDAAGTLSEAARRLSGAPAADVRDPASETHRTSAAPDTTAHLRYECDGCGDHILVSLDEAGAAALAERDEVRAMDNQLLSTLARDLGLADPDRVGGGEVIGAVRALITRADHPAAPDDTGLLTLDELIAAVENALECAAIEVVVWETDMTGARAGESSDSLHRLTRCLRSYGLLDERRDGGDT